MNRANQSLTKISFKNLLKDIITSQDPVASTMQMPKAISFIKEKLAGSRAAADNQTSTAEILLMANDRKLKRPNFFFHLSLPSSDLCLWAPWILTSMVSLRKLSFPLLFLVFPFSPFLHYPIRSNKGSCFSRWGLWRKLLSRACITGWDFQDSEEEKPAVRKRSTRESQWQENFVQD